MRRLMAVALIIAVVTAAVCMPPRRAAATDSLVYIIPAAVSGVIVVALVIAIMMANHSKEPELDLAEAVQPPERTGPIQFGQACRRPTGEMPLLCW
jgi:hypothetical protein